MLVVKFAKGSAQADDCAVFEPDHLARMVYMQKSDGEVVLVDARRGMPPFGSVREFARWVRNRFAESDGSPLGRVIESPTKEEWNRAAEAGRIS